MNSAQKIEWQPKSITSKRRAAQRGSALLIVLVFAAIVAIMLYRELPVSAFEAQRQKEELLVFRGEQYKRAVKLFVRKVGRFPNSIDELENTNRLRFLRHRYVDPLTGKDDWRLIHAGPGGVIIDSKVQTANAKGANALGQGATFAGFNNSFSGDVTALADSAPPSAALRQRPSATKNAASVAATDPLALPGDSAGTDSNGSALVLDPTTGQPVQNGQGTGNSDGTQTGVPPPANLAANGTGQNGVNAVGGSNGIGTVQDQLNNQNPRVPEQANGQQMSGLGNTAAFGSQPAVAGNNGVIGAAGGIAGVASNAPGKSIKAINDQTKYKLWEFYYDMRKEQTAGAPGIQPAGQNGQNGMQTNGTQGSGIGGFGQTQQGQGQSSFGGFGQTQQQGQGQSGFGGFGSTSGNSQTPPPPPPITPTSSTSQ